MHSLALFVFPSLLVACGPASPPEVPPAPLPSASAEPAPTAAPSASASAAAADPPEAPSPFFPVAVHGSQSLRYFPLTKGGVAIDGEFFSRPIVVDENGARVDLRLYTGLKGVGDENAFLVYSVGGDWPRSGTLSLNLPGERGGTNVDYVWNGASWGKAPEQPLGDMPQRVISAYYNGGLLGGAVWGKRKAYYVIDYPVSDGPGIPAFILAGKGGGKPASIAPGSSGCPTRLVGYAELTNLHGGDVAGIGKLCTAPADYTYYTQNGPGALAIERWAKGGNKSTVVELPNSAGKGGLGMRMAGFLEISPSDLYVYASFTAGEDEGRVATPYVAHWDGKAWKDVSPQSSQDITSMWLAKDKTVWIELKRELMRRTGDAWERTAPQGVSADIEGRATAPDGTPWVRFGEELWHLGAGGAWEKLTMPRDGQTRYSAASVAWMGSEVIIVARGGGESMLVSSKKPAQVLDLAAVESGGTAKKEVAKKTAFGRVGPPTAGCKSLFAVLYKLSRVAPPDFDFPLTRAALKGHTEFSDVRFAETEDAGVRYLVAHVPNLKQGQKLLALVREKVKGSAPQLLCGEPPKTNRTIDIDLRTGELRKK